MTSLAELLSTLSQTMALSLLLKVSALLGAGLVLSWTLRRAQAATRHLLLAATLGAALMLPVAATLLPGIGIPVSMPGIAADRGRSAFSPGGTEAPASMASTLQAEGRTAPTLGTVARLVWLAGTVIVLGTMGMAWWRLRRLRRSALPWNSQPAWVRTTARDSRVGRPVELVTHEDVESPMTWGIVRPMIVLPSDAPDWPEDDLRRVLVHELEHIRRNDWGVHMFARAACAVYWFHPLAWNAWRRCVLEAERACDDVVLQDADETAYADQLVGLARRWTSRSVYAASGMANRSDLAVRIAALLDATQRRGRLRPMPASTAVAIAVATVMIVAPVRAVTPAVEVQDARTVQGTPGSALDRALLDAAREGDLDAIVSLLAAGADPNGAIAGDGSPLIAAARAGRVDAADALLDHGADADLGVRGDGSPLIMAAANGHVTLVELFLDRGASVDEVVEGDENALIQASSRGHLDVVRMLVERGADVNARVWSGDLDGSRGEWRTPVGQARRRGHDDVVSYLRSVGARE